MFSSISTCLGAEITTSRGQQGGAKPELIPNICELVRRAYRGQYPGKKKSLCPSWSLDVQGSLFTQQVIFSLYDCFGLTVEGRALHLSLHPDLFPFKTLMNNWELALATKCSGSELPRCFLFESEHSQECARVCLTGKDLKFKVDGINVNKLV